MQKVLKNSNVNHNHNNVVGDNMENKNSRVSNININGDRLK